MQFSNTPHAPLDSTTPGDQIAYWKQDWIGKWKSEWLNKRRAEWETNGKPIP
jgi:hypothetical protein